MIRLSLVALVSATALAIFGCSKQPEPVADVPSPQEIVEQQPQMPADHPPLDMQQSHGGGMMGSTAAGPRQVEVPGEVASTWKAVVLQVSNKSDGSSEDVTVEVGQTVETRGLEITVLNFLPHFSMGGGSITSASNETVNPAAQVLVKDGEKEIFSGWLFSLYPDAHPMEHATYGVLLKDFVKAE